MTTPKHIDHIAAVFASHFAAERAVAELRSLGIADQHLGIAIHEPGQLVYEDDVEHDEVVSAEEGALAGVPLGVLAGMTLVAVVLPGIGTIAAGGLLAAGGAAGALIGGFVGGVVGLASTQHEVEERRAWEALRLQSGEVLVVVGPHQQPARVSAVLRKAGGRLVEISPDTTSRSDYDWQAE